MNNSVSDFPLHTLGNNFLAQAEEAIAQLQNENKIVIDGREVSQDFSVASTGAKKTDKGKVRWDLMPVRPMQDTAQVMTFGAIKYEDHNWMKGFRWGQVYASLQRHLNAWWSGEDKDPESGMSHLAHAACCVMFLQEFEYTHKELDDRVKPSTTEK